MQVKVIKDLSEVKNISYYCYRGYTVDILKLDELIMISIYENIAPYKVILPLHECKLNRVFENSNQAVIEGEKIINTYIEKGYIS